MFLLGDLQKRTMEKKGNWREREMCEVELQDGMFPCFRTAASFSQQEGVTQTRKFPFQFLLWLSSSFHS